MFHNHLFWTALALLFCSAMNIKVYSKYSGTNIILQNSIGILGLLGFILAHVDLIILSLQYNWWWFFTGIGVFLVSIGVLSILFRSNISSFFGMINFIVIPFFWWYGSKFNTLLSFDWFYNLIDSIRNFFV